MMIAKKIISDLVDFQQLIAKTKLAILISYYFSKVLLIKRRYRFPVFAYGRNRCTCQRFTLLIVITVRKCDFILYVVVIVRVTQVAFII